MIDIRFNLWPNLRGPRENAGSTTTDLSSILIWPTLTKSNKTESSVSTSISASIRPCWWMVRTSDHVLLLELLSNFATCDFILETRRLDHGLRFCCAGVHQIDWWSAVLIAELNQCLLLISLWVFNVNTNGISSNLIRNCCCGSLDIFIHCNRLCVTTGTSTTSSLDCVCGFTSVFWLFRMIATCLCIIHIQLIDEFLLGNSDSFLHLRTLRHPTLYPALEESPRSSGSSAPREGKNNTLHDWTVLHSAGDWIWDSLYVELWQLLAPLPCGKCWARVIMSYQQPPHRSGHGCTAGICRDAPEWCPDPDRMMGTSERQLLLTLFFVIVQMISILWWWLLYYHLYLSDLNFKKKWITHPINLKKS